MTPKPKPKIGKTIIRLCMNNVTVKSQSDGTWASLNDNQF